MSLRKVAAELDLAAHGWITQIERSEHKSVADRIVKIAHLFEISVDCLMAIVQYSTVPDDCRYPVRVTGESD